LPTRRFPNPPLWPRASGFLNSRQDFSTGLDPFVAFIFSPCISSHAGALLSAHLYSPNPGSDFLSFPQEFTCHFGDTPDPRQTRRSTPSPDSFTPLPCVLCFCWQKWQLRLCRDPTILSYLTFVPSKDYRLGGRVFALLSKCLSDFLCVPQALETIPILPVDPACSGLLPSIPLF